MRGDMPILGMRNMTGLLFLGGLVQHSGAWMDLCDPRVTGQILAVLICSHLLPQRPSRAIVKTLMGRLLHERS